MGPHSRVSLIKRKPFWAMIGRNLRGSLALLIPNQVLTILKQTHKPNGSIWQWRMLLSLREMLQTGLTSCLWWSWLCGLCIAKNLMLRQQWCCMKWIYVCQTSFIRHPLLGIVFITQSASSNATLSSECAFLPICSHTLSYNSKGAHESSFAHVFARHV